MAVTCDEGDLSSNEDFILYPCLIIEILSPSTASFDRGGKFANYQTATSLQEYQDLGKDTIYSVFSVFA
uniref:Uma2 family endonuclease n=1 Tax=Okeania sp. SIO2F4 TaxID=2607790 RepID=UPI0025CBC172|nr:Uma2 family endonuclease [Okeania sp. SIO2F4]